MMIELPLEKFSQITSFFDKETPNFAVALAVIEGNNPGRIWVDQLANPLVCLVLTKAGYSFVGNAGEIKEDQISEVIAILKENKPVKLIMALDDALMNLFEKAGFARVDRIQFYHPEVIKNDLTHIHAICKRLPSDCEIKLIDRELLQKSSWFSFIKLLYGSEEDFLKKGFGLALLKNGELISEAMACYIGGNHVETGSVTVEKYRGKGYATIVRAFLIKEALTRNLQPATSCNADNIGSMRATEKLGFKEEKHYWFLVI